MRRTPINPRRWKPPKPDANAAEPSKLPPLHVVELPSHGTEDVLVDTEGNVFTGTEDGKIYRISFEGGVIEQFADTGGRPLGVEVAPDRSLIVCDAYRGLLRIGLRDRVGDEPEVLVDEADGAPVRFCNNAAVTEDGTVYFSDTSSRFTLDDWKGDLLEHSCTGRLIRRTPDGTTKVLLDGLAFANGVALAPDESFVAVAELGEYRIRRLWLTGTKAGTSDVLADNLPGFPDNISTGSDGLIWVAVASPRDAVLDRLLPQPGFVRKLVWQLPDALQPQPKRTVAVQAYDAEGRLIHHFYGEPDDFHMVTGVREHQGTVWLGSIEEPSIASFELP